MSKKSPDGRGGVAEMKASLDKKPARPLTAADLCDRCSARAAVETVMMQGGSLLWCAHHFAFFEDALNAFGAAILVDERRRRRAARPRRMRSGARTRAANRLASSRSRPPRELGNGHKGQRLSGAGQVSCRAKPSFQRPLRVRLEISLTSTAVRLTEIWAHHQTGHRADLCCEQHHHLACREPNKDFGTHLRRRMPVRDV